MSASDSSTGRKRLDSWKEIAAFFGRDERTVNRWEKELGLPVHRLPGTKGRVYAYTDELTAWESASNKGDTAPALTSEPVSTPHLLVGDKLESPPAEAKARVSRGFPRRIRWTVAALSFVAVVLVFGGARYIQVTIAKSHSRVIPRDAANARREAQDLYLRGRFYWNTRTPEGLTQSVDYFTKATQRDPTYAPGYAGLADSYNLLREYTSMPGSQAFPLALTAAKKALELDETLPEAHRALAFAEFNWNWDIPGAEREYRRAIELNPRDAQAHHWHATMLAELARYDEAFNEIERARQLDPSSKSIAADRGFILCSSGRLEEGLSALREVEEAEPGFASPHMYLAGMLFDRKRYQEYFAESRIVARISGQSPATVDADEERYKKGGERALLEGILARQLEDFKHGRGDAGDIAGTYAYMGRKKESLEYLERSYQRHEYGLVSVCNSVQGRTLAGLPEFQELLKRAGLTCGDAS